MTESAERSYQRRREYELRRQREQRALRRAAADALARLVDHLDTEHPEVVARGGPELERARAVADEHRARLRRAGGGAL